MAEAHIAVDVPGMPSAIEHEGLFSAMTLTGAHPVRVNATGAQELRLALDVATYDEIAIELRVFELDGTGPTLDIELETGMQLDTDHGWTTLAAFPRVSSAPTAHLLHVRHLLRYLRWRVTTLSGTGLLAATFLIDGVARAWVDPAKLQSELPFRWTTCPDHRYAVRPIVRSLVAARVSTANDVRCMLNRARPVVARPSSGTNLQGILAYATERALSVSVRGAASPAGHCSPSPADIVLELDSLNAIHEITNERIVVEAGARWHEVILACERENAVPRLYPDSLRQSVGSFLATGGVTSAVHCLGLAADHLVDLEVVSPGMRVVCSPTVHPHLFQAALTQDSPGIIITRATLPLVPRKSEVCTYTLTYDELEDLLEALSVAAIERRFDRLKGIIMSAPSDDWLCMLQGSAFYDPSCPPNAHSLLASIGNRAAHTNIHTKDFKRWMFRAESPNLVLSNPALEGSFRACSCILLPEESAASALENFLAGLAPAERPSVSITLLAIPRERTPLLAPMMHSRLCFATIAEGATATQHSPETAYPARASTVTEGSGSRPRPSSLQFRR